MIQFCRGLALSVFTSHRNLAHPARPSHRASGLRAGSWARPLLRSRPSGLLWLLVHRGCGPYTRRAGDRHRRPAVASMHPARCCGGGAGTGEIQLNCSLAVLEWPVSEQTGGSPCRRLKKEIRKKRNRKRTRTSLRPMCRLTRRRKARASRPSTRSRERPEARFGCKARVLGSPALASP